MGVYGLGLFLKLLHLNSALGCLNQVRSAFARRWCMCGFSLSVCMQNPTCICNPKPLITLKPLNPKLRGACILDVCRFCHGLIERSRFRGAGLGFRVCKAWSSTDGKGDATGQMNGELGEQNCQVTMVCFIQVTLVCFINLTSVLTPRLHMGINK